MTPEDTEQTGSDPPEEGDEVASGNVVFRPPVRVIPPGTVIIGGTPGRLPPILDQPPVVSVMVKPNTTFVNRVIPSAIIGVLRPTKAVVVAQDPPPGEQVPAGTAITVTSALKETLPLDGLGAHAVVVSKFPTIGQLQDQVETNATAKAVLVRDVPFAELNTGEQQAVQTLLGGSVAAAELPAAYEDIRFAYNL